MRPVIYAIFILLMLLGNCFALYKLFTDKQAFLAKFPGITGSGFAVFRFLPLINIIALIGMWYLTYWGACLAVACGITVIALDLYFGITYHLYVAVPSAVLLLFFVIKYWNDFK